MGAKRVLGKKVAKVRTCGDIGTWLHIFFGPLWFNQDCVCMISPCCCAAFERPPADNCFVYRFGVRFVYTHTPCVLVAHDWDRHARFLAHAVYDDGVWSITHPWADGQSSITPHPVKGVHFQMTDDFFGKRLMAYLPNTSNFGTFFNSRLAVEILSF